MKINTNTLLFNAGGVLLLVISGGYMLMSAFESKEIARCSVRMPEAYQLTLERNGGGPMTGIELQARAGSREWGLLENAKVVRLNAGPAPVALEVKLNSAQSSMRRAENQRGGIGMRWAPFEMKGASTACLTYGVQLAEDFDFGRQGLLPGLYGGKSYDTSKPSDGKTGFAVRLGWKADGAAEVIGQVASANSPDGMSIAPRSYLVLPKGAWLDIEQEVVLNTPGQSDGVLRLWVDGVLRIERTDIEWRRDESLKIDGVLSDIDHGTISKHMAPARETSLRLTPYLIRWQ